MIEREAIRHAVAVSSSQREAAQALGIGLATLKRRLAEYGQQDPSTAASMPEVDRIQELELERDQWRQRYNALAALGQKAADYFDDIGSGGRQGQYPRKLR